ncbi:MAG: cytochrome b [Afipia sp.]|nr:cytochrome b [Afipia sp.]
MQLDGPFESRSTRLVTKNVPNGWGAVSRAFHWIMGLLIIGMLAYGWWMNHIPARPDRFFHRSIHADIGYVLLLLLALRLIWRAFNPAPPLPAGTLAWERGLARLNQALLYLFTFVVAILGWSHSGAHMPDYSSFFGLFRVPQFTSPDKTAARQYENWHIYMAYVLLALVVLHTLAALYHHFIRRDGVLVRMVWGLE